MMEEVEEGAAAKDSTEALHARVDLWRETAKRIGARVRVLQKMYLDRNRAFFELRAENERLRSAMEAEDGHLVGMMKDDIADLRAENERLRKRLNPEQFCSELADALQVAPCQWEWLLADVVQLRKERHLRETSKVREFREANKQLAEENDRLRDKLAKAEEACGEELDGAAHDQIEAAYNDGWNGCRENVLAATREEKS